MLRTDDAHGRAAPGQASNRKDAGEGERIVQELEALRTASPTVSGTSIKARALSVTRDAFYVRSEFIHLAGAAHVFTYDTAQNNYWLRAVDAAALKSPPLHGNLGAIFRASLKDIDARNNLLILLLGGVEEGGTLYAAVHAGVNHNDSKAVRRIYLARFDLLRKRLLWYRKITGTVTVNDEAGDYKTTPRPLLVASHGPFSYVVDQKHTLHQFRRADGALLWSRSFGSDPYMRVAGVSAAAPGGANVVGTQEERTFVFRYDQRGRKKSARWVSNWVRNGKLPLYVSRLAQGADGTGYFTQSDRVKGGTLFSVSPAGGLKVVMRQPDRMFSAPVVADGRIYIAAVRPAFGDGVFSVSHTAGEVFCVRTNGQRLWGAGRAGALVEYLFDQAEDAPGTLHLLGRDRLACATPEGDLVCYRRADGDLLWEWRSGVRNRTLAEGSGKSYSAVNDAAEVNDRTLATVFYRRRIKPYQFTKWSILYALGPEPPASGK
jgi:outer membrane protein assembly factor BamB